MIMLKELYRSGFVKECRLRSTSSVALRSSFAELRNVMETQSAAVLHEDVMAASSREKCDERALEGGRMAKNLSLRFTSLNPQSSNLDFLEDTRNCAEKFRSQDVNYPPLDFVAIREDLSKAEVFWTCKSLDSHESEDRNDSKLLSSTVGNLEMEALPKNCGRRNWKGRRRADVGRKCGSAKAATDFMNLAKRKAESPTSIYEMNRLIHFFMETGYREEAYAIYEQMPPAGCKANSGTYVHLIKGFCEAGKLSEAVQFFRERFVNKGFAYASDVIVYNAMIHGLGEAGFVDDALNLVEEMTVRGCSPDLYTYNSIIHGLGKAGRVQEGMAVLESMEGKGCNPDVITYNTLIFALGKAGLAMEAYSLYEGMIGRGCLPDLFTFNTLLSVLGKSGEVILAMKLYDLMNVVGCKPDVYTYTSLVGALCWAGKVDEALLLSVVMTENGCAPNTVTFNSWLDGLCKGGRLIEANLLLQKMVLLGYIPDTITYCILIDTSCKEGLVDMSFQLLKKLFRSENTLGQKDYISLFESFKKVGMSKQARRIARNARAKQLGDVAACSKG